MAKSAHGAILSCRQLSVPAPVVVAAKSTPTPANPASTPANPAPLLTAVTTKAKAAPNQVEPYVHLSSDDDNCSCILIPFLSPSSLHKLVASEDAKAAKEEDAGEATQQEDQHEKEEDKDEEKDFNHEEKEDTHEEKTDSNHQESQDGSASASGPQDQEPIARQKSSSEPGLNCSGESW